MNSIVPRIHAIVLAPMNLEHRNGVSFSSSLWSYFGLYVAGHFAGISTVTLDGSVLYVLTEDSRGAVSFIPE